ncbi:hypothetical protein MKEN_00633700 [Mycena kentingensis (nom. inval.)]|nr:hypothetical protein MKEN_00633700 [Mycena kentingensis (nom. inval.)]
MRESHPSRDDVDTDTDEFENLTSTPRRRWAPKLRLTPAQRALARTLSARGYDVKEIQDLPEIPACKSTVWKAIKNDYNPKDDVEKDQGHVAENYDLRKICEALNRERARAAERESRGGTAHALGLSAANSIGLPAVPLPPQINPVTAANPNQYFPEQSKMAYYYHHQAPAANDDLRLLQVLQLVQPDLSSHLVWLKTQGVTFAALEHLKSSRTIAQTQVSLESLLVREGADGSTQMQGSRMTAYEVRMLAEAVHAIL